ncbi:hypothetical protein E6A46_10675, partial [Brachyspira pilosicoli]|nr:hypothetical protein [Brachyspira pilosicoli]
MKKYVIILLFIVSLIVYSKPSDKIKFDETELTPLEKEFFTKIDNGDTNDIELYYDGFIIASGITDEDEFKFYREKLNDIRNMAKDELSQYVDEGAYDFGNRLLL